MEIPYVALLIATLLAVHGLRKKSLSFSGAVTAFIVGTLMMAGDTKVFGVALIFFYLVGSRATRYGKQRKAKLEDGYTEGGERTGWQVLSNSCGALVCCMVWNATYAPGSVHHALLPLSSLSPPTNLVEPGTLSRQLVFGALGHFGCCLGDTLASELGILSGGKGPWLVTTGKRVPPGTNGGVSVGGTVASVVGGAGVGAVMTVWGGLEMVWWGALAGGLGSLVDSVLGATIQETRWEEQTGIVGKGKRINGWDLLSNNQVNVVSSLVTATWMSRM
ncbi:uncharacterized protein BT62DRAFT_987973 [Guyanagaster necrorhizus]|uniref:Transmembrane protein 19 n=1 Tax=Guyanagaster necrorhizus TaxID=856835 RepID=A0A9P7VNY5_9AGAR|nr:uncharacterized protein BT62DRAFT_987973 [Guyanagaster necrorhizus MCA 3950]KAG7444122.1 hypothetical protein BT62DRAFT_987973 [Guyanagaster necrorhizus MCA 3950]